MPGLPMPSRTILHEIPDECAWPPNCQPIASRFTRPLVAQLVDVDPDSLSSSAQEMYREAMQSPMLSFRTKEDGEQLTTPVTDVLDLILSCTRKLRDLKSLDAIDGFGPRVTKPFWVAMIDALGLAWSEDICTLSEVSYLLPQMSPSNNPESLKLEGCAALLLSVFVPPKECDQGDMDVDSPDTTAADDSRTETSECSSSSSEVSFLSMDIPFDGHILPGRGRRISCILPVVCVAEEAEICSLVTSVVYQRRVWGISTPTVGISLSKIGTTARVFIGWIDEDDHDDYELPLVHLAFPNDIEKHHLAHGVFDLLDPVASLYFAQFILDMQLYFTSILRSVSSPKISDLCWRLDHLCCNNQSVNPHPASTSGDWRDQIETWLSGVSSPGSSEVLGDMSRNPGNKLRRATDPSSLLTPPGPPESKEASDAQSDTKVTSASKRSQYSASRFADLKSKNGIESSTAGCPLWLYERSVIRVGRVRLLVTPEHSGADKQLNDMIDLYDEIAAFAWPTTWTKLSDLPPVDAKYKGLRKEFFDQYRNYPKYKLTSSSKVKALDPATTELLSSSFTIIFFAIAAAYNFNKRQQAGIAIFEVEKRVAWDLLLYLICCTEHEAVSNSIFLERTVHFPKNHAAAARPGYSKVNQATVQVSVAMSQWISSNIGLKPDAKAVVMSALHDAQSVYNHVTQPDDAQNLANLVKAREKEPTSGRADAVLCVSISIPSASTVALSGSTTTPPSSDSVSASSDVIPDVSMILNLLNPTSLLCQLKRTIIKPFPQAPSMITTEHTSADDDANTSQREVVSLVTDHLECFVCIAVTDGLAMPLPAESLSPPSNSVLVPILFAEYKKDAGGMRQAANQCRMYCISAVEFLAALGITDFPIFGLITAGSRGSFLMVWKSSKESKTPLDPRISAHFGRYNFVMDHNLVSFDLSIPIEAYHFAITLHRIYQRQALLNRLLEGKDLGALMRNPGFKGWKMPPAPEAEKRAASTV